MFTPAGENKGFSEPAISRVEKKEKEKEKEGETLRPRTRSKDKTHLVKQTSNRTSVPLKKGDSFIKTAEQTKRTADGKILEPGFNRTQAMLAKSRLEKKFYYYHQAHQKFDEAFSRMERIMDDQNAGKGGALSIVIEEKRGEKGKEKAEKVEEKEGKALERVTSKDTLAILDKVRSQSDQAAEIDYGFMRESEEVDNIIAEFKLVKAQDEFDVGEAFHLLNQINGEEGVLTKSLSAIDILKLRAFLNAVQNDEAFKGLKNKEMGKEFEKLDQKLEKLEREVVAQLEPKLKKINEFLNINMQEIASSMDEEEVKIHSKRQEQIQAFLSPLSLIVEQKRNSLIYDILHSKNKKEYQRLMTRFATEANENSLYLFGGMELKGDIRSHQTRLDQLAQRSEGLRLFAKHAILQVDEPQARAKVAQFFIDTSFLLARKKHDYYTSASLFGGVNDSHVTYTLRQGGKFIFDKEHTEKIDNLIALFSDSGNLEKSHAKYYKKKTFLPEEALVGRQLEKVKQSLNISSSSQKEAVETKAARYLAAGRQHGSKIKETPGAKLSNLVALEKEMPLEQMNDRSERLREGLIGGYDK